ncbi:MAG: mechanosensitive ion channel family protein [Vulcanimicrobiaceae bacterium]
MRMDTAGELQSAFEGSRRAVGRSLAAALVWLLLACVAASAQTIPGLPFSTTLPSPPPVRQDGIYLTAPVIFDGGFLFRLAEPVNPPPDQLPVNVRATYVESVLNEVVEVSGSGAHATTSYDPGSFKVRLRREGGLAFLEVTDDKHTDPVPVVTVTTTDAKYHQLSVIGLAAQWQAILQADVEESLLKRQPAFQRKSLDAILRVAAALIVATLLVGGIAASLRRRIDALAEQLEARRDDAAAGGVQSNAAGADLHSRRRAFLAAALRTVTPARRLVVLRASVVVLWCALLLAWFGALTWAFSLFPQTTPLGRHIFHDANGIAVTWVVALLLDRVGDVLIARFSAAWSTRAFSSSEERARQLLRIPTVAQALAGFKTFVLVFVALLTSLGIIGIPVFSVITIGGVAAIGVTLAAQNLVRDFLNGLLVLLEDQYVVGDYVTINGQSGLVERLTLRIVQIRDSSGDLTTIPHSSVTNVINQSRNWSRVDFRVSVDPGADIPKALDIVRSAMQGLGAENGPLRGAVLEPVEWIGVSSLSRDGVVIRASMKTAPLRQFELRRELSERVRKALSEAGIALGAPLPDAPA